IAICLLLLTLSRTFQGVQSETEVRNGTEEELIESETKDGKLEIVKRIKKINDDGSYTIGYEADDGSFKIESRDVLGNVKGTYGFLDDEGQIKRVSYSSSNSSEIIAKPDDTETSVVQRIPNKNKTSSTRRPSTTASAPTSTPSAVIQSIARRRTTSSSTTTQKPNYNAVINVSRTTTRPPHHITYPSASPRILLQGRPLISSTPSTQSHTVRSEGQLIRPEVVTVKPTELPSFRRLDFKHLDHDKPVVEDTESEIKGNILRRQLSQDNTREFNIQEQLYSLQQSLGQDATDVYSGSVTTGTPRPLFTTTNKPNTVLISSTTPPPESVPRPTVRYPVNYQRNAQNNLHQNSPEYTQETMVQSAGIRSTPSPLPVVQIPANRVENQEPLVAIRHPFQRATVLVPLSQLHGRLIPVEDMTELNRVQIQYEPNQDQYYKQTTRPNVVEIEQQKAVVRQLPPPQLRPIPVQVDENGYVREIQRQVPRPDPIAVEVTPVPNYTNDDVDNDVDSIQPPVSTRDFQKLLQELIAELFLQQQQRYRPVYAPPQPYFVQKEPVGRSTTPIHFIHQRPEQVSSQQKLRPSPYYEPASEQQRQPIFARNQPSNLYQEQYDAQAYRPNRRVARLLPSVMQGRQEVEEQYLPPEVREMLLLRMLQLAINPALKLEDGQFEISTESSQFKRVPVRNVEILGEEPEPIDRRSEKSKRYRESGKDYE
ncbi:hypothetical protein NQ318_018147, partial [Aromia moschata]